jgi:hypothetical protein
MLHSSFYYKVNNCNITNQQKSYKNEEHRKEYEDALEF